MNGLIFKKGDLVNYVDKPAYIVYYDSYIAMYQIAMFTKEKCWVTKNSVTLPPIMGVLALRYLLDYGYPDEFIHLKGFSGCIEELKKIKGK